MTALMALLVCLKAAVQHLCVGYVYPGDMVIRVSMVALWGFRIAKSRVTIGSATVLPGRSQ